MICPWSEAPPQPLPLHSNPSPEARIAHLAHIFSLVPRCVRVNGEWQYTRLWKLLQCSAPPLGVGDFLCLTKAVCSRPFEPDDVAAVRVLEAPPITPCPTEPMALAADVFSRAPADFLDKFDEHIASFLRGGYVEVSLFNDFFEGDTRGAPWCVYVPTDLMTFQSRNFAMVARIRLLLPPVRPDVFTVLHVLH